MSERREIEPLIRVIGVGNPHRGDDAIGRIVARRLSEDTPNGVDVVERDGEAAGLMDAFANTHVVIIVDAAHSGTTPGHIHRFDAHASPLPAQTLGYSTHGFGVAQAVELARALGTLPPTVVVFGVEAAGFDHAPTEAGLSAEAEAVIDIVLARVRDEIAAARGARHDA